MSRRDAQPTVEGGPAVSAATDHAPLGSALEPNLYLEPEIVRLEQEAIFERTWQLAGHVSDLREPGSYLTADVVDQPVLVGPAGARQLPDGRRRRPAGPRRPRPRRRDPRVPQRLPPPRLAPAQRKRLLRARESLPLPPLEGTHPPHRSS